MVSSSMTVRMMNHAWVLKPLNPGIITSVSYNTTRIRAITIGAKKQTFRVFTTLSIEWGTV